MRLHEDVKFEKARQYCVREEWERQWTKMEMKRGKELFFLVFSLEIDVFDELQDLKHSILSKQRQVQDLPINHERECYDADEPHVKGDDQQLGRRGDET